MLPSALELMRGRFMACSGAWDWAPYSPSYEGKDHTFSRGLVGFVYLLAVEEGSLAISEVVPQLLYAAADPIEPLVDGAHAGFVVRVKVFGFGGAAQSQPVPASPGGVSAAPGVAPRARARAVGTLTVAGSWGASVSRKIELLEPAVDGQSELLAEVRSLSTRLTFPSCRRGGARSRRGGARRGRATRAARCARGGRSASAQWRSRRTASRRPPLSSGAGEQGQDRAQRRCCWW
ncbi:hypothetical protein T492DRAFT_380045 [Pavlovales sp. CCMP2436]|nr:hypothetical protein T492DRAFT_380045 [Pavlovales sp. CCMP2436]